LPKIPAEENQAERDLAFGGDVCPYIYFVNSGCLRIYMMDVNGKGIYPVFSDRGQVRYGVPELHFAGAITGLYPKHRAYRSALHQLHDFRELLDTIPGWERVYRINLEMDYIASIKRIESLITMDATQRYKQLMETTPTLIQRLPNKIIADYLGISQETLSRLKSKK
jgi:CRP-like cAMP-binding protein